MRHFRCRVLVARSPRSMDAKDRGKRRGKQIPKITTVDLFISTKSLNGKP